MSRPAHPAAAGRLGPDLAGPGSSSQQRPVEGDGFYLAYLGHLADAAGALLVASRLASSTFPARLLRPWPLVSLS